MSYLSEGGKETTYSGISILSSEILWKKILIFITTKMNDIVTYRESLLFISFISLFIYASFLFKRVNIFIAGVLLFNPMFMQLIIEQVRMALAFALLVLAYEKKFTKTSIILVGVAVLIHTATLLMFAIYMSILVATKIYKGRKLYFYSVLFALVLALFLKYGVDIVLAFMGDRRVGYSEDVGSSGIKFSIFWFILSLIFLIKCKVLDDSKEIVSFSIIMMNLLFFSALTGNYGHRYVAVSIPLIIYSINTIQAKFRLAVFFLLFIYTIVLWFYWFKIFS